MAFIFIDAPVLFNLKNEKMKKSVVAIIALFTLSLASCKKEYRCECQKTRTTSTSTQTSSDGQYTFKDKKSRATSRCNDLEKEAQSGYTRECSIK